MPGIDYKSGISHWKAGTKPNKYIEMEAQPYGCLCKWDYHEREKGVYYVVLKFRYTGCPVFDEGGHE